MKIYIDADASPIAVKEIIYKISKRLQIKCVFVANQFMRIPTSELLEFVLVSEGADEADNRIVELMDEGDLVITADIPLADRVVKKGGDAIDPRGILLNEETIGQRLGFRNFMEDLRNNGVETGGPSSYGNKDKQQFANLMDRYLTKKLKG